MTIAAETVGLTVKNALYQASLFSCQEYNVYFVKMLPGKRIFLGLVGINEE
jgi:hypothetical protein